MTLFDALICGIWVWLARTMFFYWAAQFFSAPLSIGICLGALLGDWETGAIIGATVQTMYLTNYGIGAVYTNDGVYAAVIPVAFVICNGMPQEAAIAIAVPFGLLASQLMNLTSVIIAAVAPKMEEAAKNGNSTGVILWGSYAPAIIKAAFWIPITMALLFFGGDAVTSLVNSLPEWAMNGLSVITLVLPGLGYAMIMHFIGRDDLLPFFLGGFLFAAYTGVGAIPIGCIGAFVAYICVFYNSEKDEASEEEEALAEEAKTERLLTQGDVVRFWFGSQWWGCVGHNTLTMHASGLATPMAIAGKKIYKDDPEEYTAMLERSVTPYITNFNFGGMLNGALLSLEEQRGINKESVSSEVINSTKYALAGPLAAVGDTIDSVAFMPICLGVGTSFALEGAYWACLFFPLLLCVLCTLECFFSVMAGYKLGSNAAVSMLASGKVKTFLEFMAIMGTFTLAGVACGMVSVNLGLSISQGAGDPIMIQSVLDTILPQSLSLITMLGMYFYLRNGGNTIRLLAAILVLSFALGSVGILV